MSNVEKLPRSVAQKLPGASGPVGKLRAAQQFVRPIADIVCRTGVALLCGIAAMLLFSRVLGIAWVLSRTTGGWTADVLQSARGLGLAVCCLIELSLLLRSLQKIEHDVSRIRELIATAKRPQAELRCVEVVHRQLHFMTECLTSVIEELQGENADVTFLAIRKKVEQQIRKREKRGEAMQAVSYILDSLFTTCAGDMFDIAVEDGICPLQIVAELAAPLSTRNSR